MFVMCVKYVLLVVGCLPVKNSPGNAPTNPIEFCTGQSFVSVSVVQYSYFVGKSI